MTITTDTLSRCLNELAILRGWPRTKDSTAWVSNALTKACQTDSELIAVTKRMLNQLDSWPGPATFTSILRSNRSELYGQEKGPLEQTCGKCWEGLMSKVGNVGDAPTSFPCTTPGCVAGEFRRRADRHSKN
jgi:hypothetical protein